MVFVKVHLLTLGASRDAVLSILLSARTFTKISSTQLEEILIPLTLNGFGYCVQSLYLAKISFDVFCC